VVQYSVLVAVAAVTLFVVLHPIQERIRESFFREVSDTLATGLEAGAPTAAPPPALTPAGPVLTLTESVAASGTVAVNVLSGLGAPEATLTAVHVASGGGVATWSPDGQIFFRAPDLPGSTVITFAYTWGPDLVTGSRLTITIG
jgi:hypothetical protein